MTGKQQEWCKVKKDLFQEGRIYHPAKGPTWPYFCFRFFLLHSLFNPTLRIRLETKEMLTNNGQYDLRPHLFLSWRAHLYFMYRAGSKVLVSKGALERKTESYRDSWVNLHVLTLFFSPIRGTLFSVLKVKEFCRPKELHWLPPSQHRQGGSGPQELTGILKAPQPLGIQTDPIIWVPWTIWDLSTSEVPF